MNRFFSPLNDIKLIFQLYNIFKTGKFDIVHNMTIKPNIYGTYAAKLAGIKHRVCLVAGAGFVFMNDISRRTGFVKLPVLWMYKLAMSLACKIWFQNADDLEIFAQKRIIAREKGIVIRSGGINVQEYSPISATENQLNHLRFELRLPASASCVLMVAARMIWSKGINEFLEAARRLYDSYKEWYFVMVCPRDEGTPDSVPEEYLTLHSHERLIVINTFRYDIKSFIALSDIMVLPSYYPEGVPRFLLEGLAMGKPIITTDHQGCRETVDDNQNGYLIPVKDAEALTNKLDVLMSDKDLRARFGRYSRQKAISEFDENFVIARVINELYGFQDRGDHFRYYS
jgi:N,N'-diacetylbacillosaminyl-diphospho-undecaprenol alpha-1,3-N-acetylgalactosaminyltransferase